jgi:hypothetical protein
MICTPFATFRCLFKAFAAIVFLFTFSLSAHAVLINFDDLTYVPVDPEDPSFDDFPLDNQYLSQGLSISNAFLLPYDMDSGSDPDRISGPNYLLAGAAGDDMTLSFVGRLPTHVGMYVGAFSHEMIFTDAYGPAGLIASLHTAGDGGPFNDQSPYIPKQYLTFESAGGISRIDLSGWYGSRVSGFVDDITYTYADVPEPSPLVLLGLGVLALTYRRVKKLA